VKGPPSSSSRDKVTKRRRGKERMEWGRDPWWAVLAFLPRGPRVPSYATARATVLTHAPDDATSMRPLPQDCSYLLAMCCCRHSSFSKLNVEAKTEDKFTCLLLTRQRHRRSAYVWHALSTDHTVFPVTHAFIHET